MILLLLFLISFTMYGSLCVHPLYFFCKLFSFHFLPEKMVHSFWFFFLTLNTNFLVCSQLVDILFISLGKQKKQSSFAPITKWAKLPATSPSALASFLLLCEATPHLYTGSPTPPPPFFFGLRYFTAFAIVNTSSSLNVRSLQATC